MDERVLSAVTDLVGQIDGALTDDTDDQTTDARELFGYLRHEGGAVEPYEPFDPVTSSPYAVTPAADLGNWEEDPWGDPTYGVDASTTRPMEYDNGLIVDVAHAVLGVSGADADRAPERESTVATGVYTGPRKLDTPTAELDGQIMGELIEIPADQQSIRNVTSTLASVVQRRSESYHARRCLDEIDGPLFLDGAVYPLSLLRHVPDEGTDADPDWELPTEILETYVEVIDHCFERGVPVYGVVKTSEITTLLRGLREKIRRNEIRRDDGTLRRVPYRTDAQFVAAVLRDERLTHVAYTDWFVETEPVPGADRSERLDPVADVLEHGDPADYRRAFCHVRLPETGTVFRIETPLLFLEHSPGAEAVRLKALSEIARRGDVPGAVIRADRRARITRGNRDRIRHSLENAAPTHDYNADGRWDGLIHGGD